MQIETQSLWSLQQAGSRKRSAKPKPGPNQKARPLAGANKKYCPHRKINARKWPRLHKAGARLELGMELELELGMGMELGLVEGKVMVWKM